MKYDKILLALGLTALLSPLFLPSCANTTQAPTGGPKDTIPPYMVYIDPAPGATMVPLTGAKFYFEFNEYVKIKDPKNIMLSPPQKKAPKTKLKGRGIVIHFEEPLDSNTTYTISFTGAIEDNNESNPFAGFSYVFSTGQHIDSMLVTGTVRDCNTLQAFKNATVMLYTDLSDSAVFLKPPVALAKTDDWGFFSIPYIKDTSYRLYAIKDESGNNIYDPDTDLIAFADSVIRPVMHALDTLPEMLKYDMKDTLNCEARKSEHELLLFREKPTKQFIKNSGRLGEWSAFISFQAPNTWIDSLWVKGYKANEIISEFNITRDSLLLWINRSGKHGPDTMHVFVNYRKTDSLGLLKPEIEHLKLVEEGAKKEYSKIDYSAKKSHEDSICKFTLKAESAKVEDDGFDLRFDLPPVKIDFSQISMRYLNPRQKEFPMEYSIERDSLDLRHYILRPKEKLLDGYEYFCKVAHKCMKDISGWPNDSTEVKVSLPKDESSSTLNLVLSGVKGKIIVDLTEGKGGKVLRSNVIDKDATICVKYLKEGKYAVRITDDSNRNSIVDTGCLLEHRQPEKVVNVKFGELDYIEIPPSSEINQTIEVDRLLN